MGLVSFAAELCVALAIAYFTWRMVQVQTHPSVLVYAEPRRTAPDYIQIVIKNVGNGIARNVRFRLSRPIPERGSVRRANDDGNGPPEPMTTGPLVHGIPALGPGSTRVINWGMYEDVAKALGDDEPVAVSCEFEHHYHLFGVELSKKLNSSSVLEVGSLLYTSANPPSDARMAMAVERIAQQLERVGDNRPFRVSVESLPQLPKDQEAA